MVDPVHMIKLQLLIRSLGVTPVQLFGLNAIAYHGN